MRCSECREKYSAPDIIEDTAYFICSGCGHVYEVKNYHPYTKDQIVEIIETAFSGVVLGQGTGLLEAQALDDYEPEEVQRKRRDEDEKISWNSISYELLQRCRSSLSFFDADGMKFHLPAFIIGSIKGEVDDPIFHLTHLEDYSKSKFATLNEMQINAVIKYLTWCLTEEDYEFDHPEIARALTEYWDGLTNK